MAIDVSNVAKSVMDKLEVALQCLLPDICAFCGDETRLIPGICTPCHTALPRNDICCPRCANPTPLPRLCPECLINRPRFTTTISPFLYTDAIRSLVTSAKFHHDLRATASIGHLLGRHIASVVDTLPDVIVPVPLHRARLRERGYNQAVEITKVIQRYVPVPIQTSFCRRNIATDVQSSLKNVALRHKNVHGAFEVSKIPNAIHHVVLVDDVMTTGSTVQAISNCLTQAGIQRVGVWVFARAMEI